MARLPLRTPSALVALALSLAVALVPVAVAIAAPAGRVTTVNIVAPGWIPTTGEVAIGIRVTAKGDAGTVTAGLRVVDSNGNVRWAQTKTRSGLDSATYDFSFASAASALGLAPGVYQSEATVRAGSAKPIERRRQLIVFDPSAPRVPVTIVVRVAATPASGDSSTALDTARTAADTAELARLSIVRPDLNLTVEVPPYLLDEWSTAATESAATGEPSVAAAALDALRTAVAGGLPLLRGLYGEPDLSALATAPAEIERHADAGLRAREAALSSESSPSASATGFGTLSGLVPASAAPVLLERGVSFLLLDPASLRAEGTASVSPVRYRIPLHSSSSVPASSSLLALVIDRAISAQLADPSRIDTLTAATFVHSASRSARYPITLEVLVGQDGVPTTSLEKSLDALSRVPWIRLVDAPTAAIGPVAGKATLRALPLDRTPAPQRLTTAIGRARVRTDAFVVATVPSSETTKALTSLMLAESRAWSGSTGAWTLADRAFALASIADRTAWSVLSKVTVAAPGVTLPASEGKVRVSVVNGSDRVVKIVLDAVSQQMKVRDQHVTATLEPGENILSVPVALGTATSGRLRLTVRAGGLELARTSTTVKASYQDRISLLVAVVAILVGLLFYIRRKMARGAQYASDRRGAELAD